MIESSLATKQEIDRIIYDPEIYDRISDDNCPKLYDFKMDYSAHFIAGHVGESLASLFIVHGEKMHYMVLKPQRRHAKELLDASFKLWPYPVYVEIPSFYRSVINFAKKYGFTQTSIEKNAHLKNGRAYDVHTLRYEA